MNSYVSYRALGLLLPFATAIVPTGCNGIVQEDDQTNQVFQEIGPAACGTLLAGQEIRPDNVDPHAFITSCDRRFALASANGFGLFLSTFDRPSNTIFWRVAEGAGLIYGDMQTDGNFVAYNSFGTALWNSGTWGHPFVNLRLQDDGNLVIYSPDGVALWNSGTGGR